MVLMVAACSTGGEKSGQSGGDGGEPAKSSDQNERKLTLTIWTLQQADINIQEAQENAVKAFEEAYSAEVEITAGFR